MPDTHTTRARDEMAEASATPDIECQVPQLEDRQWPAAQRQAAAAQLSGVVGNRQFQRIIRGRGDHQVPISEGDSATPSAQRFEEGEHKKIGDEATAGEHGETKTVALAEDYRVTYGEMIAMSGDHFGSVAQMRELAKNPGPGAGSREELEYVRIVKVHGNKGAKDSFSAAAQDAADKRFFTLAGDNRSHFLNPATGDEQRSAGDKATNASQGQRSEWDNAIRTVPFEAPLSAGAGYRQNHVQALFEAYYAGVEGQSIDSALAAEAFSNHFLTDAFSSGHLRTERASIADHWNARVPMFTANLQGYIAEKMAEKLEKTILFGILSEDMVYHIALGKVAETLEKKGGISFGALVAGAIHDYDNKHGVQAQVEGSPYQLYGDTQLGKGAEKYLAVGAVRTSLADVEKVYALGKAKESPLAAVAATFQDGLFAAEHKIPTPLADSEQAPDQQQIKWDYDGFRELLGDAKFQDALKIFCENKAKDFVEAAAEFKDADQRAAFMEQIVTPLRNAPVETISKVINWTPDTGGGWFGHKQDDNALDYYQQAKKAGALDKLSVDQKTKLIIDLSDGITMGDEEDAIWDMLNAKGSDAPEIIRRVGWKRLHSEIDGLIEDKFEKRFPAAQYAK